MRSLIFLVLIAAFSLLPAPLAAQQTLTVGINCLQPTRYGAKEAEALVKEMYARAGLKAEVILLPNTRDLVDADGGVLDAVLGRTKAVAAPYEHLVPLELPMGVLRATAMKTDIFIWADSWKNLLPLRVAVVKGEETIAAHAKEHRVRYEVVEGYEQAFKMLKNARVDALLCNQAVGKVMASKLGYDDVHSRKVLFTEYIFHFVNKRKRRLGPGPVASLARHAQRRLRSRAGGRLRGHPARPDRRAGLDPQGQLASGPAASPLHPSLRG